jgi:hypothetical protein
VSTGFLAICAPSSAAPRPDYDVTVGERSAFLESLTDTELYSMGAFF